MSKIIEKYVVCRELNENLKQSIRLLYIFEDNEQVTERSGYNVFFITEEDQIYAFGNNSYAQLGFGHNRAVKEPRILSELCDKNIIAFANSLCHVIALSSYGKIFCWGSNNWGLLGIGSEENRHYKPIANLHLNNEIFIDICCGFGHSLVLTTFGEVYSWGSNNFGQIGNECNDNQITPFKVNGFRGKKVSMISCGSHHSLALTECGQVYSWGRNEFGQLGLRNTIQTNKPNLVKIVDENNYTIIIEKISCGTAHSLLLSTYGDIYLFGYNRLGQLGTGTMQDETSPKKISTNNNFIDIASHWTSKSFPFATALSFNGIYYIWGERGEEINLSPKQTNFESFIHIFAYYTQITPQVIDFEEYNTVPVLRKNKYKNDFSEKFQISSGAFGVVYKAEDKKISRNYAIKKIVLNGKGSDKTFRELKLMKKLKSRYVVEYYDSWLEENDEEQNSREKTFLLHIQMEFYSETLNAILFMLKNQLKESFELLEILSYYACSEFLIEILECVNYLHKRGVIHRDLKPENIMITKGLGERFVKLSDFGLSIMQEFYDESHTQLAGTSKYMAPEVVRTTSYGTKADIYSLGIITEELFDYTIIE
jgi:alpha-tubulin suppressor-like RCC1 family protein